MIEISAILVLVFAGVAYFELRGGQQGRIVYLLPSERFRRLIQGVSALVDWRAFGDAALAVVMGPLACRYVERKRSYIVFLLLMPFMARSAGEAIAYLLAGVSGLALYYLLSSALSILSEYARGVHPSPGVGPLIPGVSLGPFRVPLVEGVVALLIALIVHEGAHGCVALRRGVPVNRAGLVLLGFLPVGAFVDPSEHVFRRKSRSGRLQILAAGPFANVFVGVLFSVLVLALSPLASAVLDYECSNGLGARVLRVPEAIHVDGEAIPSPAHGILQDGDIVLFVDENRVRCASQLLDALSPFREREENATVSLVVLRNGSELHVSVTLNRGYLGVQGVETVLPSPPLWYSAALFLVSLLSWISLVNAMVGIANALPLPPLDGGHMFRAAYPRAAGVLVTLTLGLLVLNVLPWFV